MIAIWNRKEVMLTNDMERLAKARYALQGAGIVYALKIKNLAAVNHGACAVAQDSRHSDAMYHLYVNKQDEQGHCMLFRKRCAFLMFRFLHHPQASYT